MRRWLNDLRAAWPNDAGLRSTLRAFALLMAFQCVLVVWIFLNQHTASVVTRGQAFVCTPVTR